MSTITVNISETIGQESAIEANGSPVFTIKVTSPAVALPATLAGEPQEINGFGRVVSSGPVKGHTILFALASVVAA